MTETQLNAAFALFGGTLLVLGLVGNALKSRWSVSEPLLAAAIGALVAGFSPAPFRFVDAGLLEQVARLTLVVAVVDAALALPADYLRRQWRSLLVLLGGVMPMMWLASSLSGWAFAGLSAAPALLLGAVLTPTDPVLSASVVSGTLARDVVPASLRSALLAESGANDVLGFVFVSLALLLLGASPQASAGPWAWQVLGRDTLGGIVIGVACGGLAARVMSSAHAHGLARMATLSSTAITLGVGLLGAAKLLGSNGILAAFVAALMLNRSVRGPMEERKQEFHETFRRFLLVPVFVLFGMLLPWREWSALGWGAVAFLLALFLLRRLPAVWMVSRGLAPIRSGADVLFAGWFGPIGVAALYYGTLASRRTGDDGYWYWASLAVAASVLVHGVSSVLLTRWYARATVEGQGRSPPATGRD